ncbi:hypothetical protein [uncultured Microbulbifer sp.]|uniref:5-methylcytosine restriction system specificity protein McrC n=1 Tax=uncultured Microbulbifer sp. TaxID=348147 RepID=UPI0025E02226|nr:hypothetical protein [uncultured Microbulbifer sp.]
MRQSQRLTAIEYAEPVALVEDIVRTHSMPYGQARELIQLAGDRVRTILGLKSIPISWSADQVQFKGFAGLLVLSPRLELEVAPKFLGNAQGWREDFFLLATLSHHGRLLDSETLQGSASSSSDLATLIGRSLVQMYWKNQRRPLRSYRRLPQQDFAIEGDFDAEDLVIPNEEGFSQQVTYFTRENPYNAVIRSAAAQLAPHVNDSETRARLERTAHHLPIQTQPSRLKNRRLPSRSRGWQPTFDLSLDILRGLGGTYDLGTALAPGYVMSTWQVWEHLISSTLRIGLGGPNVTIHPGYKLGERETGGARRNVTVIPDVIVSLNSGGGHRQIIVDAKYKGNIQDGSASISNADIYESLAFSKATGINEVALIYPQIDDSSGPPRKEVGNAEEFSKVIVDGVNIRAIGVGVCGISQRGGLSRFASTLVDTL